MEHAEGETLVGAAAIREHLQQLNRDVRAREHMRNDEKVSNAVVMLGVVPAEEPTAMPQSPQTPGMCTLYSLSRAEMVLSLHLVMVASALPRTEAQPLGVLRHIGSCFLQSGFASPPCLGFSPVDNVPSTCLYCNFPSHPFTPTSSTSPWLVLLCGQILNISAPLVVLDGGGASPARPDDPSSLSSIQLCLLDTPGPNEAGEEGLKYQVDRERGRRGGFGLREVRTQCVCLCANALSCMTKLLARS